MLGGTNPANDFDVIEEESPKLAFDEGNDVNTPLDSGRKQL